MTNQLRAGLPPIPYRMLRLPIDDRGFPVPWFVAQVDGRFDFRLVRENGLAIAYKRRTCWLCGEPLGRFLTFVIGPMCAVNRTTSEPPSHHECATFAAKACPFLTTPAARRNERALPAILAPMPGIHLDRNPGVACLWTTRAFQPFVAGPGILFELGDPMRVEWFAQARQASRAEVDASIAGGFPSLLKVASDEGQESVDALHAQLEQARALFPAE